MKMLEILSPPTKATVLKVQMGSTITPKRRRMANLLDVVLETTKTLSPAPTRKVAKAFKAQTESDSKQAEIEAVTIQAETEAGPSVPTEMQRVDPKEKSTERIATEKSKLLVPKRRTKVLTTLFVMLRERYYPKKKC
jgi:predicted P-loop ATPase